MNRFIPILVSLVASTSFFHQNTTAHAGSLADANVYFGGFVGLIADRNEFSDPQGFVGFGNGYEVKFGSETPHIGVLLGIDHQFDRIRIGLEMDAAMLNNSSSGVADTKYFDETIYTSYDALVSVRARLSVPIHERLQLFGTVGGAIGWVENRFIDLDPYYHNPSDKDNYVLVVDPDDSFTDHGARLGWVIGAGLDWQATDIWSARFDVSYVDFGTDRNFVNKDGFISSRTGKHIGAKPYDIDNTLVIARFAMIRSF